MNSASRKHLYQAISLIEHNIGTHLVSVITFIAFSCPLLNLCQCHGATNKSRIFEFLEESYRVYGELTGQGVLTPRREAGKMTSRCFEFRGRVRVQSYRVDNFLLPNSVKKCITLVFIVICWNTIENIILNFMNFSFL